MTPVPFSARAITLGIPGIPGQDVEYSWSVVELPGKRLLLGLSEASEQRALLRGAQSGLLPPIHRGAVVAKPLHLGQDAPVALRVVPARSAHPRGVVECWRWGRATGR